MWIKSITQSLTWQEVVPNQHAQEHKVVHDAFNIHRKGSLEGRELKLPVLLKEADLWQLWRKRDEKDKATGVWPHPMGTLLLI